MSEQSNPNELLALTTEIVAAHVGNNTVAVNDLPQLIQDVFRTLASVGAAPPRPTAPNRPFRSRNRSTPTTSSASRTARS